MKYGQFGFVNCKSGDLLLTGRSERRFAQRTGMIAQKEYFKYDNLDRLETVTFNSLSGTPQMKMTYANNGNIDTKTGLGTYGYGGVGAGPYALTKVDNTGGLVPNTGQTITYNAFKKTQQINETVGGTACRLDIMYGPDRQRWKTELRKNNSLTKTIVFAGDYEKITEGSTTKELIYLPGGAIYVKQAGQSDMIYYAHKDHLGSIMKLTDGVGTTVFAASYDVWGKQTITNNTFNFHRGYL